MVCDLNKLSEEETAVNVCNVHFFQVEMLELIVPIVLGDE